MLIDFSLNKITFIPFSNYEAMEPYRFDKVFKVNMKLSFAISFILLTTFLLSLLNILDARYATWLLCQSVGRQFSFFSMFF